MSEKEFEVRSWWAEQDSDQDELLQKEWRSQAPDGRPSSQSLPHFFETVTVRVPRMHRRSPWPSI